MNFIELDEFLRQPNDEDKFFNQFINDNGEGLIKNEIKRVYSNNKNQDQWVINSSKMMKEDESFAIHQHKRFISFQEHKHDYIELIYVYSGVIKQRINGLQVNIKAGEICILDLNATHSIESAGEQDIAINILMTESFFNSMFMSSLSENDIMSKFIIKAIYNKKENSEYLIFHSCNNEYIQTIMKRLLCECFDKKVAFATAVNAYILLLFTEFLRDYKNNMGDPKVKDLDVAIITEIKNYLYKNYKVADLKSTSEHFHFNPDYLSKLIKNLTGDNFIELLQNIKLKETCTLLKNSDFTIEEIMNRVGYGNMSYFYKLFKKNFNLTPVKYRNLHKK
ncbi:MAG TPA: AraC family transcriptional regulator [Clostridiaceae bacterium]